MQSPHTTNHVERHHSELCLASRLFDTCYGLLFVGHRLSYVCFRQFCKGLVVLGATERIKLPFVTLCPDNLAYLSQLTEIGDSWPG